MIRNKWTLKVMNKQSVQWSWLGQEGSGLHFKCSHTDWASQVVLEVKNPPASAGDVRDTVWFPGWEGPQEEEMATHSSIFA